MLDKHPEGFSWVTFLWVFAMAVFGGFVSYLSKIKTGRKWKWTDLAIELITSSFAAVIVFLLCQSTGVPELAAVALSGISARFSDRAIRCFGKILDKVLKQVG